MQTDLFRRLIGVLSLAFLGIAACAKSPSISAVYRGLPDGLGDAAAQKLGKDVTASLPVISAKKDDKLGVIHVNAKLTPNTAALLRAGGSDGVGPCLPDRTTYSYYLLRMYDRSGQLLGVSEAAEAPVNCTTRHEYDFAPFEQKELTVTFPANATLLRDAENLEFSLWFEPRGERGVVTTDARRVPPSWRTKSNQGS